MVFKHEESVNYAISVFRDVRLFGRNLLLQHRTSNSVNSVNERHRTLSAPPQVFRPPHNHPSGPQGQNFQQMQHQGHFSQNHPQQTVSISKFYVKLRQIL